jgi:hypothetical protein
LKALCVCKSGSVRSVALARMLRKRGHEAIGVGLKQRTLLPLLLDWADTVYAMDADVAEVLWKGYEMSASLDYALGPDDWYQPDHPDLVRRLRVLVEGKPPRS